MRNLYLLFIFIFSANLLAQNGLEIPIICYWEKGDTFQYRITKIEKHTTHTETTKYDSTVYTATLTVIDSTKSSYKMKWSMNSFYSNDTELPKIDSKMMKKYNLNEIFYQTNEMGEFMGITNWKEYAKFYKEYFVELTKKASESQGENKKKYEKAMKLVSETLLTKESIESNFFPEIPDLHFPFGYLLSAEEGIEVEGYINSLFSDEPMATQEKIYFQQLDLEDEYCTLVYEMKVKPEDAKREVLKFLTQINKDPNFKENLEQYSLTLDDYNVFNMYYYPGIITKSDLNRFVEVEGGEFYQKVHKRLIIELITE